MSFKKCYKCGIEKDESEFYKDKRNKDGLCYQCKECRNQYDKARYARPENKEKAKQYRSKPENKERKKQNNKEYNARPEIKEKIKEHNAEYRIKPENKKIRNQREKERYQTDSCYKLKSCISALIRNGLKKNCGSKRGSSILSKLPYSMQELKQHIESLFEPWMNWENHGKYNSNRRTWQIDHIKPHSSFHYDNMDCEEFRQCWALSNLRPLESLANIKKGNKIG